VNDNIYFFNAGAPGSNPDRALWNFDWSINTNTTGTGSIDIGELTYLLEIDYNPSGTTPFTSWDLINDPGPDFDHSFGNNGTDSSTDTVGTLANYPSLIADNSGYYVAQNSWNMAFFNDRWNPNVFDPNAIGTYDITLTAYDGDSAVASTTIRVLVGGGAPVPEPASLALLGIGIAGLAGARLRKRRT